MNSFFTRNRRLALGALVTVVGASLTACNASDRLLQAIDPDIINPQDVQSADGADAVRIGAISRLTTMTGAAPANAEGVWFMGGLLTDEWKSGDTFVQRDETDKRTVALDNSIVLAGYRYIHRTRISANQAIGLLRKYKPLPAWGIGQMYFLRAYAEVLSAENFCNGQPFADGDGADVQNGTPHTVAEAFARAVSSADSAISATGATATDAASLQILYAARITKARALMGLGGAANYALAKAAVTGIPTSYAYNVTFSPTSTDNGIWALNNNAKRYVVGDSVEQGVRIVNAIPFVSSRDKRVPTSGTGKAFDSGTLFSQQLIWASAGSPAGREDPIAVVNGIDARMIEAEVALSTGDVVGWLAIHNALRAGPTVISQGLTVSAMGPLVDPVDPASRISLQFREKAYWTFGRGERLGDMRRLIRQYSRTQDQVFPTGNFNPGKGGTFGTDVNLPVPQAEQNNPNSKGCTDRNA